MPDAIASILQLVGLALVAVAAWLAAPALGVLVAGVSLVAIGLAVERGRDRGTR